MLPKADLTIERITGSGPGGQHRNKTASCVRVTHNPTGLSVCIDGRHQHKNLAVALKELARLIQQLQQAKKAAERKARRDHAIRNDVVIRSYKFKEGIVIDHRTGKRASLKEVLGRG